jgi:hypothetical protein
MSDTSPRDKAALLFNAKKRAGCTPATAVGVSWFEN